MKMILISLLMVACASKPKIQHKPNRDFWVGKSIVILDTHPRFATMPLNSRMSENGIEVRTYNNSSKKSSSVSCYNEWGITKCDGGDSTSTCNHVFIVADKKVTDYKRVGRCAPEQLWYRPIDPQTDEPELADYEGEHYRSIAEARENCGTLKSFTVGCE